MSEIPEVVAEIPQDTDPGLAGIIAYGPAVAFARQISDLGEVAAIRGTPEAEATLAALRRLTGVLEAEPIGGAPTARDIALFALGEAVGRWKAAEEQKGGRVPERGKQAGQRKGGEATKHAKEQKRVEDAELLRAEVAKRSPWHSHTQKLRDAADKLGWKRSIATLRDMCPTPTNKKGPRLPP